MKRHLVRCFILFLLLIPQNSYSQNNLQVIGELQYAQWDGIWYTAVNGERGAKVDTDHVVIRLKNDGFLEDLDFADLGIQKLEDVRGRFAGSFYELKIPALANPFNILRKLYDSGLFVDVHLNIYGETTAVPDDDYYPDSWNLPRIQMPQAWDLATGSSQIIVAVIDVGTEYNHPDLVKNKWSGIGYDFYDMDSDPSPENLGNPNNFHGTAVTGVLCADLNNSLGVSGMAGGWGLYKGITFMSLRVGLNRDIDISAASDAIVWAANHGADIISCSWTTGDTTTIWELEETISYATYNKNVVVVFSSGNYYEENVPKHETIRFPATLSTTIAVGATTEVDQRKDWAVTIQWGSCYGPELDVVAPGIEIPTTDIEGQYGKSTTDYYLSFSGTSAAAPHVSALAALIVSINPGLDWQEVRDLIRDNAAKVGGYGYPNGRNDEMGWGRINAYATLLATPVPLTVEITGPTHLDKYENGDFTANPSGGSGTYVNYRWWKRLDEGGGPPPKGMGLEVGGGITPNAPPPGEWFDLPWLEGQQTVRIASSWDFSLKCRVYDSEGETAEDIHSVDVGDPLPKAIIGRSPELPETFALHAAHPNPFNPSTTIRCDLPEASRVTLVIYDIMGREVRRWELREEPGFQQVIWDGKNQNGQLASAGIYIYRLTARSLESDKHFTASRKMVLMK